MALYRSIEVNFWNDSKIMDSFTPEDKYFYLYLFTNPHTNLSGCYEISKRIVAFETGYTTESIEALLKRFEEVHKVLLYDQDTKEVLLLNWHKHNWTSSDKYRKALLKEIESIKCSRFREYLEKAFKGDTVSIPYQYPSDTTNTITISNTISNTNTKTSKKAKFEPPTVEEVEAYCKERGNNINARELVDFYTANGWVQGKGKPIKDWRAVVRTWEQRRKSEASPKEAIDENARRRREKYKELEKYYLGEE